MRWEPGDEIERTRFFQRVVYGPDLDFCHLWVGPLGDDGYGRLRNAVVVGRRSSSDVSRRLVRPRWIFDDEG